MSYVFYKDPEYKKKQSEISRSNWEKGKYQSIVKPYETRRCRNPACPNSFTVKPYDPKQFCSRHCSVAVHNIGRKHSAETKLKISQAIESMMSPLKGIEKVARIGLYCQNCGEEFKVLPYLAKRRKYCCTHCAICYIGRQTTSPKASKGKPGIRLDIDPAICFYSTWEANIARAFNLVGIVWQYAPKIFDLGQHTYRPDFYLPQDDVFIEVKNFMGIYSLERDQLFRKLYPNIRLDIIGKETYKQIETEYKPLIDYWE